ncbi:MAG TPA: type 1 glutamine amidotransferase domain-containing protein [Gammaproteobacteria bacterium]|nr:type 1 glutamine amidotransferase domain-containing protein [Gammaproteobacteria bacterium]
MASGLHGKKVAILATDGFEQSELLEPRRALKEAGAATKVVSPADGKIRGWNHGDWGEKVDVDVPLDNAQAADYDALLLPGGVMNPDRLRMKRRAVEFVREFFEGGKPVAAICHGPWMLVEAGVVEGRTLTSWPSLATDIRNAGGTRVDEEVFVCTGGPNTLVTSRKPDDIPAFNEKMLEAFAQA